MQIEFGHFDNTHTTQYERNTLESEKREPNPDDIFWIHLSETALTDIKKRFKSKTGLDLTVQSQTSEEPGQIGTSIGITRKDLQTAGIYFLNRVSRDNEKPLLAGTIVIDGNTFDLDTFAFLTKLELQQILTAQAQNREQNGENIDFDKARKYAFSLLDKATTFHNSRNRLTSEVLNNALLQLQNELSPSEMNKVTEFLKANEVFKQGLTLAEKSFLSLILKVVIDDAKTENENELTANLNDKHTRNQYFQEIAEYLVEQFPEMDGNSDYLVNLLNEILPIDNFINWRSHLAKVDTINQRSTAMSPGLILTLSGVDTYLFFETTVRAKIQVTPSRFSILRGTPSPFIVSGFVFDENPDLTVTFENGEQRRLNMVVPHLWSQGLDEMGGEGDQIYFTAQELTKLFKDIEDLPNTLSSQNNIEKVKKFLKSQVGI